MDRLPLQPWMRDPAALAVMAALEAAGGPGCARYVGGCVRNALLGAPVDDVDISTVLEPPATVAALQAAGLKAVPTGVAHGTVTAVAAGRTFEVTSLRRDVETDGRRAVVAFTTDWAEDAQRRDFNLNALYAEADGTLHDPTGRGLQDIAARRIAFIGAAAQRIREDHLRILRFFRFLAWYGMGEVDAPSLAACAALRDTLGAISAERIRKELLKLLAAPQPLRALQLMQHSGVLAVVLGEDGRLNRLARWLDAEAQAALAPDPLLRLRLLLADPLDALAVAARLRLSNAERARLLAVAAPPDPALLAADPASLRRAAYRAGVPAVQDRLALAWAEAGQGAFPLDRFRALAATPPPAFPLKGADLVAAGLLKGPAVGETLKALEDWWVNHDFPSEEELRAEMQRHLPSPSRGEGSGMGVQRPRSASEPKPAEQRRLSSTPTPNPSPLEGEGG